MLKEVAMPSDRMEKHTDLANSILELDHIVSRLVELVNKVEGLDNVKSIGAEVDAPREMPSLVKVLNSGSGAIREKISQMHNQIDTLNDLLF